MSTNPDGLPFQVLLSTGETFVVNTPLQPGRGFFGITTDVAIASIRFTTIPDPGLGGGIPLIDNFSFAQAQAAAAPEPATIRLLGTGLVGIATRARRRKSPKT